MNDDMLEKTGPILQEPSEQGLETTTGPKKRSVGAVIVGASAPSVGLWGIGLAKAGPIASGLFAKTTSTLAIAGTPYASGSCMAGLQSYAMSGAGVMSAATLLPVSLAIVSYYAVTDEERR